LHSLFPAYKSINHDVAGFSYTYYFSENGQMEVLSYATKEDINKMTKSSQSVLDIAHVLM